MDNGKSTLINEEEGINESAVEKNFIELENVKIFPGAIVFRDAFEGRHYTETITIQNCGPKRAFIRILAPSSYALKIKQLERGAYVAAGLKIVRKIHYTYYTGTHVYKSFLPIIINGKQIDYQLYTTFSSSLLVAEPCVLDFGTISIGEPTDMKTITLRNDGTKLALFTVDLSINDLTLIIEPRKGYLEPQKSTTLRVEIVCIYEGPFEKEFWICSSFPVRIKIRGAAVFPKLDVYHPKQTKNFVLVDFPRTYIGSCREKQIVFHNKTNACVTFCILGQHKLKNYFFSEAQKMDPNFQHFKVNVYDGRFLPREGRALNFTFAPVLTDEFSKTHDYEIEYLCIFTVVRLHCRDIRPCKTIIEPSSSISQIGGSVGPYCSAQAKECDYKSMYTEDFQLPVLSIPLESHQKVWVYGMVEKPRIKVLPNTILLDNLKLRKREDKVLTVTNLSENLPITISYKKIAFVDIEPNIKYLEPQESFEAKVSIKCFKLGGNKNKIKFDLLHKYFKESEYFHVGEFSVSIMFDVKMKSMKPKPEFNLGLTPYLFNEVGRFVDDITFSTKIKLPKMAVVEQNRLPDNDVLIAFPNDRPKSLRPWMNPIPCKTIFTRLPRVVYSNSTINKELLVKKQQSQYYSSYLKEATKKQMDDCASPNYSDYDLTDKSQLLCQSIKLPPVSVSRQEFPASFIPLTPFELYNIKIYPRLIKAGRVVVVSPCENVVYIENNNEFPIRVRLQSQNIHFSYPEGDRRVVKPLEKVSFKFLFFTTRLEGVFTNILEVVVNDTHVFDININGVTIPRYLDIDVDQIVFGNDMKSVAYINIHNNTSADISYQWEFSDSSFDFEPPTGYLEPYDSSSCTVTYNSQKMLPNKVEAALLADGKLCHIVYVSSEDIENPIRIEPKEVNFNDISINIPTRKFVVLTNTSARCFKFRILNPTPTVGIEVSPVDGVIKNNEILYLEVIAQIPDVTAVNTRVDIEVQRYSPKSFGLKGQVVVPEISVTPNSFKFKKMQNNSIDTLLFTIKNVKSATAMVEFALAEFKEFAITEANSMKPVDKVTLEAEEAIQLCMWYRPIDVSMQVFYLPIKLNGCIDPPNLDKSFGVGSNLLPQSFGSLKDAKKKKLPEICVRATTMQGALTFSKTHFKFQYYPNPEFSIVLDDELIIKNDCHETQDFLIRIEQVKPPFAIYSIDGNNYKIETNVILIVLEDNESIKFNLRYQPRDVGTFKCTLPIYLRDTAGTYHQTVYNYLELEATFPPPTLKASVPILYLEAVPLRTSTQRECEIIARYHVLICQIRVHSNDPDVKVKFISKTIDPRNIENILQIAVSFSSNAAKMIEAVVEFTCSCGSKCFLTVKTCTENCSLTNHAFIKAFCETTMNITPYTNFPEEYNENFDVESMSIADMSQIFEEVVNTNLTTFPYFPTDEDSNYTIHMQNTARLLEEEIYYVINAGAIYWSIPGGFAMELSEEKKSKRPDKEKKTEELPMTTVIQFFTGSTFSRMFSIRNANFPDTYIEKVRYIWHIYKEMKTTLIEVGALLPNIEPEYLLTYNQYLDYFKCFIKQQESESEEAQPLDRETFLLISKQNWVDLLLQTLKVFTMFSKANSFTQTKTTETGISRETLDTMNKILRSEDSSYNNSIYHPVECMILFWIESVYNRNRHLAINAFLPERIIKLFDVDFYDSVVLAVVTITYCPFLKPDFQGFYWIVENYNEAYFNASKLLMAWDKLEFGRNIVPVNFVHPNPLFMVQILLYFYDFVSNLSSIENIDFAAQLGFENKNCISVTNENDFLIKYKIIIYQNDLNCFRTNVSEVELKPKSTVSVQVTYWAKFLQHVDVYLLFNGTFCGYHCAQNMCYLLHGKTLVNACYEVYRCKTKLNKINDLVLTIKSPYPTEAQFDINFQLSEPKDLESMKIITIEKLNATFCVPRRILFAKTFIETDETGIALMGMKLACFMYTDIQTWIVFTNKDVGSFIISLAVYTKKKRIYEKLEIGISQKFLTSPCICQNHKLNFNCPKMVPITILQKYPALTKTLSQMFYSQLENERMEDLPFWKSHFETEVGTAIMRRLTEDYVRPMLVTQYDRIFEFNPKFWFEFDVPIPGVIFPDFIKIKHNKPGFKTFYIHVDRDDVPENMRFVLLYAVNSFERCYELTFVVCD